MHGIHLGVSGLCLGCLAATLALCGLSFGQPLFEDVAPAMGLDLTGTAGGVFWYDYDNDGDLDLLHSYRFMNRSVIFRNDGDHFTRLTDIGFSDLRDAGKSLPLDFDHDGDLDLWLSEYGSASQLMVCEAGQFVDRTIEVGLAGLNASREFAWIDMNRDGWLDLLWSNLGTWKLLRNDNGTHFTDVTASTQLPDLYDLSSFSEADIDLDGDADLYVTRIGADNHFYINEGNGVFTDRTTAAGLAGIPADIGCAWADFDNDKFPDLLTQGAGRHDIWHNNGNGTFTMMAIHGTQTADWGGFPYGACYAIADFDMDKDLDIYAVRPGGWGAGLAANQFFRFDSLRGLDIWFTDIAPGLGMNFAEDGQAAWGDYDGDGALDLYVSRQGGADALFHNNTLENGNRLEVRLLGPTGDQSRWHSRVEVYPHGETSALTVSELNYSNVNRNGLRNYFVLDENGHYDLRVYFTCGTVMLPEDYPQLSDVVPAEIDHLLTVYMGVGGTPVTNPVIYPEFRMDALYPNPFNSTAMIQFRVPVSGHVRLAVYDVLGRHITDLVNGTVSTSDPQRVTWNAKDVPSGVYFLRLEAGSHVAQQKALLLK